MLEFIPYFCIGCFCLVDRDAGANAMKWRKCEFPHYTISAAVCSFHGISAALNLRQTISYQRFRWRLSWSARRRTGRGKMPTPGLSTDANFRYPCPPLIYPYPRITVKIGHILTIIFVVYWRSFSQLNLLFFSFLIWIHAAFEFTNFRYFLLYVSLVTLCVRLSLYVSIKFC